MRLWIAILMLTGLHVPAHADADVQAGKVLFASRCAACHSIGPNARAGYGPHLTGVIGRPVGGTSDYKYSPAMKNSGIVWSESRLRQFLADPDDVVPGNKMRFWGIGDERQLDRLLAYLKSQS